MKPAFWTDSRVANLAAPVRLTYIGLWMVADDAGWFRWDVAQIANELYGYEARSRREKAVARHFEALVEAGRVVRYPCDHAQIPTMAGHQHLAGTTRRVTTVEAEHTKCPATPRELPRIPAFDRAG